MTDMEEIVHTCCISDYHFADYLFLSLLCLITLKDFLPSLYSAKGVFRSTKPGARKLSAPREAHLHIVTKLLCQIVFHPGRAVHYGVFKRQFLSFSEDVNIKGQLCQPDAPDIAGILRFADRSFAVLCKHLICKIMIRNPAVEGLEKSAGRHSGPGLHAADRKAPAVIQHSSPFPHAKIALALFAGSRNTCQGHDIHKNTVVGIRKSLRIVFDQGLSLYRPP